MNEDRSVDIVVPVFNEARCVEELVSRLRRSCPEARLIFVDNASTDGTPERLEALGVETIRHAQNEGYGKSLSDGIAHGTAPCIVTIDADLEYPPESIPAMLEALDRFPVVYGSRFLGSGAPAMSATRRAGNALLTRLFDRVYRQKLTDLYTGIKAFRREVVSGARFRESGFVFVVEFTALASKAGPIGEIAVPYAPRLEGRSKMRHLVEGLRALMAIVAYRFSAEAR